MIKEPVSLEEIANAGVSLIFYVYGLRLSVERLKSELANWKSDIIVQVTTFFVFSAHCFGISLPFVNADLELLWLGMFFLAALPSTVSSSVVMVSIAKGNIPRCHFNASIFSLIGVVVTPLSVGH